jgi:hypothetical protein
MMLHVMLMATARYNGWVELVSADDPVSGQRAM